MKTPLFFLEHILESIDEIEKYTAGVPLDSFVADPMRYNATIRMITVIGEAISKLELSFKESYPVIPWKDIRGMRNNLIHEYWQTDLEEVYLSATRDVPELKGMVLSVIADMQKKEQN